MHVRWLALLGLSPGSDLGNRVLEIVPADEGAWVIWTLPQTIYFVRWLPRRRELVRFPRWETVWILDDTGQEIQLDAHCGCALYRGRAIRGTTPVEFVERTRGSFDLALLPDRVAVFGSPSPPVAQVEVNLLALFQLRQCPLGCRSTDSNAPGDIRCRQPDFRGREHVVDGL